MGEKTLSNAKFTYQFTGWNIKDFLRVIEKQLIKEGCREGEDYIWRRSEKGWATFTKLLIIKE